MLAARLPDPGQQTIHLIGVGMLAGGLEGGAMGVAEFRVSTQMRAVVGKM